MPTLRVFSLFRPSSATRFSRRANTPILSLRQHRLYADQSYGGGEGDPKGENPQDQGSNPSADLEHPGPPPPPVGQGTGGGPTKAHGNGHNTQQNDSSGGGSSSGSSGGSGAQPKIYNEKIPTEENEDVRKHNEEMRKRHDRAEKAA